MLKACSLALKCTIRARELFETVVAFDVSYINDNALITIILYYIIGGGLPCLGMIFLIIYFYRVRYNG